MKISWQMAAIIKGNNGKGMHVFNWYLNPCEAGGYSLSGEVKTSVKITYYPIIIFLSFFYSLWDGGLKTFPSLVKNSFSGPFTEKEYPNSLMWERMDKIYKGII